MELRVSPSGRYTGANYGRAGVEPLGGPDVFYGDVYCLVDGVVYAAWNDVGIDSGNSFTVVLSPDKGTASISNLRSDTSPYAGTHEVNVMQRVPDSFDASDLLLYYNGHRDFGP
jgi:hypothetical protein